MYAIKWLKMTGRYLIKLNTDLMTQKTNLTREKDKQHPEAQHLCVKKEL